MLPSAAHPNPNPNPNPNPDPNQALPAAALELLLRGEPNDTPLPAARAALFKAPAAGALDWCYGHGWACCAAAARPPTCGVFVLPAAALRAA